MASKIPKILIAKRIITSRSFWYCVIFLLFLLRCFVALDPDFGWHLRSGEHFLIHGIPAHDIYTFTAPSFPWIDHEWLNDIVVSLLYDAGGYPLLAVIFAGLWTAALIIAGRRIPIAFVVLGCLACFHFTGVRTITWSVLFVALTLLFLTQRRGRLLLIPLFLLWANLHGSFVLGLFIVAYKAVRRRSWKTGALLVPCIAVTLLNPYGWHVYEEVWRTLSDSGLHFRISEWQPFALPLICLPYVFLWIGAFGAVDGKNPRAYVGLDTFLLAASFSSVRNIPLFVIVSLPALCLRSAALLRLVPRPLPRPQRRFLRAAAGATIIIVLGAVFATYHSVDFNRESSYPQNAVRDIRSHPCHQDIFNAYGYGGYLIWKLPEYKVYIDGRMPSWQDESGKYLMQYFRVTTDPSYRREQFARYGVTCALVSAHMKPFMTSLRADGWSARGYGDGSVLLRSPDI